MHNFTAKRKDQNANIIFRINLFLAKSTTEQLESIKKTDGKQWYKNTVFSVQKIWPDTGYFFSNLPVTESLPSPNYVCSWINQQNTKWQQNSQLIIVLKMWETFLFRKINTGETRECQITYLSFLDRTCYFLHLRLLCQRCWLIGDPRFK